MIQYILAAGRQYGHACRVDQASMDTRKNHYYYYMTTLIYNNKVDVFIMMMMFMYTNCIRDGKRNVSIQEEREREREKKREIVIDQENKR